jgi:DNA-binding response OmpR family regulator
VAILTAFPMLGSEWKSEGAQSMLVKPMNTEDLLRQIEALLIQHEDQKKRHEPVSALPDKTQATQAVKKTA